MKIAGLLAVMLMANVVAAQKTEAHSASPSPQQTTSAEKNVSTIDPAKEADIRRLFEVGGTRILVTEMMAGMEGNLKPLMTNALPPGEYREKLVDLFFEKFHSKANAEQILDLVVPVYDKYLSDAEIKALIDFYSTPLGQKTMKVLPRIMIESQEAGRKWGEQLGQESMVEVLNEHPELKKAAEEAGNHPAQ